MALNSSTLKQMIVDHIKSHPNCIKNLFPPSDQGSIDELELLSVKVWKRTHKETVNRGIVRYFAPLQSKQDDLSDQVSVEIVSDLTDTQILSFTIEG